MKSTNWKITPHMDTPTEVSTQVEYLGLECVRESERERESDYQSRDEQAKIVTRETKGEMVTGGHGWTRKRHTNVKAPT